MSLATRCPVCQTVFRVVQDQLKVSEGWVRCGRCAKVFNAFEGLFDLEREFPALRAPAPSTPSQRVLEDLARRNPKPQPVPPWEQELDTRASVRDTTPPAALSAPGPSSPAPQATRPAPTQAPSSSRPLQPSQPLQGSQPSPPSQAFPASRPGPLSQPLQASQPGPSSQPFLASQPAPSQPFQPSRPFQGSQPFRPSQPASLATPRATAPTPPPAAAAVREPPTAFPRQPIAAPARPAWPAPALVQRAPEEGATVPPLAKTPAPTVQAAPTAQAAAMPAPQAPVAPATPPIPAQAAKSPPEVEIRAEPTPVAGTEPDSQGDEQSFEALFRSDGEMAEPATQTDGVDIEIDAGAIEPASLDDAVDSRLLTFVQQADKAERWRRPWVRATLAAAAVALTLLLGLQILVARRDAVVAQWPQSRALLQTLCAPLDCRIEPLRRIEQISVDSSGLTRIDDGPVYRLALVLRNRGETQLLVPAIDLSLTDASGALVTRRMLSASELGAARTTIAAGQELPLQALLMSAERPLTGYTIEIFYP